ncbi:universal stress protein [Planctomicrobium sp. SH664]|uniref:universal stress protein n=1 Tax=Planctomicrobium sp. SH664 TaxID=3448125 RepID=UPI003F5C6EEE
MVRIQKILVPTDFSEFSQHALRYGCELARKFEAELLLLNVVEDIYPLIPEPGLMLPTPPDFIDDLKEKAGKVFVSFPPAEWSAGLNITRTVRVGTPFLEIIRYARESECDLLVIGTHGRSGLAHVLMGSTAEKIVRKAPCPVLTVRPEGHEFVMP